MNWLAAFVLMPFLMFSLPAAAAPNSASSIRTAWYGGRRYVYLNDIAQYYHLSLSVSSSNIVMRSKFARVGFVPDKRYGSLNGVAVTWLFPPVRMGGRIFISEYDFRYLMEPVLRPGSIVRHNVRTILIDAGHGGNDKGAVSVDGRSEKNATLAMAKKLAQILSEKHYRVFVTRSSDKTVSLDQRVTMNEHWKPDLFISIHCNSVGQNHSISGIETYAATPYDAPSSGESRPGKMKTASNRFDKNNFRLAYGIQRSLSSTMGMDDRGVKHARFFVIRNSPCPAVLIETGFISNRKESHLLFSEAGQNAIANAIARGISDYVSAMK